MSTNDESILAAYRPELIVRDGRFFFRVRELGLLAGGEDVQSAYEALCARGESLVEQARAADLLDELPPPGASRSAGESAAEPRGSLRGFLLRVAIVAMTLLVVTLPVAWSLGGSIDRAAAEFKKSTRFGHWLERELSRAAREDKALEPERQARMLGEIRVLVSRARPFVDELRVLFADGTDQAEPVAREP